MPSYEKERELFKKIPEQYSVQVRYRQDGPIGGQKSYVEVRISNNKPEGMMADRYAVIELPADVHYGREQGLEAALKMAMDVMGIETDTEDKDAD